VPDAGECRALAEDLALPAPLAALLVQRGYRTREAVEAFLRPRLDSLSRPDRLAGMVAAVDVIVATVRAGQRIFVHGDYDVDGQCAATVLTRALRAAGADVHPFLPHRMADGYDFGPAGLAEATRIGAALIVTCDCGITAVETVTRARDAGMRVVVTDHHLPGPILPPADAIIDPQRTDDSSGLGYLCGTGVIFKLVLALAEPLDIPKELVRELLAFVALATVADVVPLVGENRTLVTHGLRTLAHGRWVGLRALIDRANLAGRDLRASQVGFILAPRLNAVGRIADANDGLRLLLSDQASEADALAGRLEQLNRERQDLDQRILEEVMAEIERDFADPVAHRAIVLARDGWHPGVVGIVASRVVERYGRPTFLIGLDGAVGKGSGRSIEGFDLHAALLECADLLERFGGHRMAAGLSIRRDAVPQFREMFCAVAARLLSVDQIGPTQRVDIELPLGEVTEELERWSRQLEPCGMGNPGPVFGVRNVRLTNPRVVGSQHLKGALADATRSIDTIAFGWADRLAGYDGGLLDAAFRLELNEWNGRSVLQARALALAPAAR
jgi:single-stranded-DNA-specific exonuclease